MSFHLFNIYIIYIYIHRTLTRPADWVATYLETGRLAPHVVVHSRFLCSLSSPGEYIFDLAVVFLGRSSYFERRR